MVKQKPIILLNHKDGCISKEIYTIFQNSYQKEADLIGIKNFPPLQRTKQNIQESNTQFWGLRQSEQLAAVVETSCIQRQLDIHSLVVNPSFFRQGLASYLLQFILKNSNWTTAIVETAVANQPAIKLYQKLGFIERKRWIPTHGIPKILLSITKPTSIATHNSSL